MREERLEAARWFLAECRKRILRGESTYGPVQADDRVRSKECIEECYDIYNYSTPIMFAKHPEMKNSKKRERVINLTFRLYEALLDMLEEEEALDAKKGGAT